MYTQNESVYALRIREIHERLNISANPNPKSKIFQMVNQESAGVLVAKSLKTKKPHASVPVTSLDILQAQPDCKRLYSLAMHPICQKIFKPVLYFFYL